MSGEENRAGASLSSGVSGPAVVLSVGLTALASGAAIFLLAALLLPPAAIENDQTFFVYGLLGQFLLAVGALLIMGGLVGVKAAHWPVVLVVLAVAGFAAYGFHWPGWLLPAVNNPFRPFIGQFALGGLVFVFFLVVVLSHRHRFWPMLWKPLLVAGVVVAVAIALFAWLYSRKPLA